MPYDAAGGKNHHTVTHLSQTDVKVYVKYAKGENTLIEVKNLTKVYGSHTAVDHIDFTIESGHIYGFLGPNGAGKSTTMNMLTGCLAPTEGDVLIDGKDIYDDAKTVKKQIGYLPEIPPVYPDMTPEEYLFFVAEAKGLKGKSKYEQVWDAMEQTDIIHMKDRLIKNLSKGYRQRVGIAQAMIGDPEIMILDEPTVGLDPKQIIEIRELIKRLGETKTIILSSHILSEVSAVCDRVMIIANGKLVASDTLENIRTTNTPDNRVLVTARGDREKAESIIKGIEHVVRYDITKVSESVYEIEVDCDTDYDIREKLFFAFAEAGIGVSKLVKSEPSLEEVFLLLTNVMPDYDEDEDSDNDGGANEDDDTYGSDGNCDDSDDGYTPMFSGRGEE